MNAMLSEQQRDAAIQSGSVWQAAIDMGLDLSDLDDRLALTPAERLRRHDRALTAVMAMRQAGIKHYGFDPRPAEATP